MSLIYLKKHIFVKISNILLYFAQRAGIRLVITIKTEKIRLEAACRAKYGKWWIKGTRDEYASFFNSVS